MAKKIDKSSHGVKIPQSCYKLDVEQVLGQLQVDATQGLSDEQVRQRRSLYGPNELPRKDATPLWKLVLEQFKDQLVQILLLSAIISFCLALIESPGEEANRFSAFVEPAVILLILVANAIVGVVQESNAEKAIEALEKYAPDEAKVARNGAPSKVRAAELVPGDIVDVSVGDKVPADLRIIQISSTALRCDQAILTGESSSVQKYSDVLVKEDGAVKQDQVNMLFSGTTITMGRCRGVVISTGSATAIGEIQASISACDDEDEKTPLKRRLDEFGDQLAKIISIICVLVWVINFRHFSDPIHGGVFRGAIYYFKIAVALAVAAIPEGLAVVITTCLALGTKKMAKNNAIVRTLPSVETLGCTSVICSDKTGTLTTNRMCVTRVAVVEGAAASSMAEYEVEGSDYSPVGCVRNAQQGGEILSSVAAAPALYDLMTICSLCNDASIVWDATSKNHVNHGEPTEAALKALVEKLHKSSVSVNAVLNKHHGRILTFDFDRDRKSMSVICEHATDSFDVVVAELDKKKVASKNKKSGGDRQQLLSTLFAKGAPESVLDRCSHVRLSDGSTTRLSKAIRTRILATVADYGKEDALRVLACALRENIDKDEVIRKKMTAGQVECEMTFVGLVGMLDPPREEVCESIRKCHEAGIRVIVVTGDNQNTAEAICRKIGVFGDGEDLRGLSWTGKEFDALTEAKQRSIIKTARLFSRTEPAHKHRLVRLLQEAGHVVAMTGDGVNDAPALKKADIGVAMGSGTDVAKLAADMVLADDNFSSIVKAVEEGRSIYNNTKQFIRYLISSNIGEVVSIFLTVLLGMPEALIPVQLLWVNLVTDGLPATALGFNPPDHEIMKKAPRSAQEPIVSRWLLLRYCIIGAYVGLATVGGYAWWFMYASNGPHITLRQLMNYSSCATAFPEIGCSMFTNWMAKRAATMSLSVLVTIEMFNAMNSLSENESLLTLPLWCNPSLVLAISLSMALHFMILYVPFLANLFAIAPLNRQEWQAVVLISLPIIFIDEILKFISRCRAEVGVGGGKAIKTTKLQ